MRIEKIILENFIGIWIGLNKKRIEIDFNTDSNGKKLKKRNKITMLVGMNGSGKTSLLSTLHPFAGTQDERTTIILPGTEGYKEIHISSYNNMYIIKHYYKKMHKSYIAKNGVELNPTGGVRSFIELVKQELDVDEDYFTIGKIGGNVRGFIDYKTAERKKYISKFLPNIEDYLITFKIVSEKFKEYKKEIKYLSDQLNKLDTKENLEIQRKSIKNQLDSKSSDIEKSKEIINKNKGKIDHLDSDNSLRKNGNPFEELYKGSEKKLRNAVSKLEDYYDLYPHLKDFSINMIDDSINEDNIKKEVTKNDIDSLSKNIVDLNERIVVDRNSIKKKKDTLNEISGGESINELKEFYQEHNEKLTELNNFIAENHVKFKKYKDLDYSSMLSVKSVVDQLKESVLSVKKNYSDDILEIMASGEYSKKDYEDSVIGLKRTLGNLQESERKLQVHMNILMQNVSKIEILKDRPTACRIDNCAFIRDALKYKDIDVQIENKQKSIDEVKENIKSTQEDIDAQQEVLEAFTIMENAFKLGSRSGNIMLKLPCSFEMTDIKSFMSSLIRSDKEIVDIFDISELTKFLQNKENYEVQKEKVKNIKDKLSILEKNKSLIDSIEEEISSLEENISINTVSITENKEEIEKKKKIISKIETRLKIYQDLKELLTIESESKKTMEENRSNYEKYEKIIIHIESLLEEIDAEAKNIKNLEMEIKPLNERLESVINKIHSRQEYELRKENIEDRYEVTELIKESLDPIKGIPLHFIGNYLKETARITNELLDIAYQKRFRIDFEISDKDFYIHVYMNNDTMKDDINEASQGEVALTSISLSLAMIEQSMTKYNILQLDEIDATLDTLNRSIFITMLEKQIEKMNIEQVFVISHNNEFDAYPVDMILFRNEHIDLDDKEFIKNKNIIENFNI